MTVHMASDVSMTVQMASNVSILNLENIADDGPCEALSMTVHMAFVDDRTPLAIFF
jgi:hypothetical protein